MTLVTSFVENFESLASANGVSATGDDELPTKEEEEEEGKEEEETSQNLAQEEEIVVIREGEDTAHWRTNIFTIYARIFRIMLAKWKERMEHANEFEKSRELDNLVLPSNEEWRYQVYYRLVDLQREIDLGIADNNLRMNEQLEIGAKQRKYWDWEPTEREFPLRPKSGSVDASIVSLASAINDANGSMTEARVEPGWRIEDIILAARVLQEDSPVPSYRNEAEMRRVFGLVYDVLRYKQILNQALRDVGFWCRYDEHKKRERIVWLLLYDMQWRKFSRRRDLSIVKARDRAFSDAGIQDIEDALVETRTRLAASVSRLRIGGSALCLDELLPAHLRNAEGINNGASLASGWVNTIKLTSKAEFIDEMAKLELRLCANCNETELDEDHYIFDPICPKVVNLHDKAREKLAMSELVTSHRFIFLERSLCVGAAALAKTIRCARLCGPIVLTHSIAPRHTGYLAGLIADIEDAGRLLAFGTGEEHYRYEEYLAKLGITNQQCRVFAERYATPPSLPELERATVVLSPPSCSYTGIRDVVDLAVARNGDTRLLESLTNIDIEAEQPEALLTEQLTTLKHALTRPNVQLLIYEAHSLLPAETYEMVDQVVRYANEMAVEKYSREHPPKRIKPASKEPAMSKLARGGNKSGKSGQYEEQKMETQEERRIDDDEETVTRSSADLEVPESDIFEIGSVIDIFGAESAKWLNDGCYLAVVKRKEMMQFNSLFMIKVAESKGLFGDPSKRQQESPKEEQKVQSVIRQGSHNSGRRSFKRSKIQVDRIAASTHSSLLHSSRPRLYKDGESEKDACPRHIQHVRQDELLTRSQTSHSSIPTDSSKISASSINPQRSTMSRENEKTTRKLSSKLHRSIFNEKTLIKNSKLVNLRDEDANQSQSISTQRMKLVLPKRSVNEENFSSKIPNDNGNSSTFSFGHGARALATAIKKMSPINDDFSKIFDYERDKENSQRYKYIRRSSSKQLENKISRSYHPGGSLEFSRLEVSKNHRGNSDEYYQGFPYLLPGTGNAAAAAGLDNLPNN